MGQMVRLYDDWGRVSVQQADATHRCIWDEHRIAPDDYRLLFRTIRSTLENTPQCCVGCVQSMLAEIDRASADGVDELGCRQPRESAGVGYMVAASGEMREMCLGCGRSTSDHNDVLLVLYDGNLSNTAVVCHPSCWEEVSRAIYNGMDDVADLLLTDQL